MGMARTSPLTEGENMATLGKLADASFKIVVVVLLAFIAYRQSHDVIQTVYTGPPSVQKVYVMNTK
jgi:hypothetical protein